MHLTLAYSGSFSRVWPSRDRRRAHVELSTDNTGSALYERYCERVFREPKMAVARLHSDPGLSSLYFLGLRIAYLCFHATDRLSVFYSPTQAQISRVMYAHLLCKLRKKAHGKLRLREFNSAPGI